MSVFNHGIIVEESATRVAPAVPGEAIMPVVFGTAPVNMVDSVLVNEPIIAWSFDEAKESLGYTEDFENYTLCEAMKSYLKDYKQAPIVFVNVLDPATHKTTVAETDKNVVNKKVTLEFGVIKSSVVVKNATTPLVLNTDYLLSFDDSGYLVITATSSGAMAALSTVKVGYNKLNPAGVDKDDIIGGVNVTTGVKAGLELINEVFPKYKKVPSVIMAPKFCKDADVAAAMNLKADSINGNFKAMVMVDLEASSRLLSEPSTAKETKQLLSTREIVCWPKSLKDNLAISMSTILAGTMAATDNANGYLPYVSPSNKEFLADKTILDNGEEIRIGVDEANTLNSKGIVTAVNFVGGMKSWGNRLAYYQTVTTGEAVEPKNVFIAVRRMIDYINNSIILRCWEKVDDPMNKRLISEFLNEINLWFNSLTASGALLGGRIELYDTDNPTANLMDGKLQFRVYVAPPVPAEEIIFVIEYDPSYLGALFA